MEKEVGVSAKRTSAMRPWAYSLQETSPTSFTGLPVPKNLERRNPSGALAARAHVSPHVIFPIKEKCTIQKVNGRQTD
jgi:hypothetical protein